MAWGLAAGAAATASGGEPALNGLLGDIRAVEAEAAGGAAASKAWQQLAHRPMSDLPAVLAGMDGANALATNWIAMAVQAMVERQTMAGSGLPVEDLEEFTLDRRHSPRGRRLAFELLLAADRAAAERLVDGFVDDPSLELRREAIERLLNQGAAAAEAKKDDEARGFYRRALDAAREVDQVKLAADRLAKLGEKVDLARELGYLLRWQLIGPFDNTERKGFATVYPPERQIEPAASYPGKVGDVRWIDYTSHDAMGKVDFFEPFGKQNDVVGYAITRFTAPAARDAQLRLSSNNATRIWLNGKELGTYEIYHTGGGVDQYVSSVKLEAGTNIILVKVCQNEQTQDWAQRWDFQLRVTDAIGAAVLSQDAK